ncbi:flagellar hook-basal body protein [Caulobacter radicis]|uniref:Flagellar hook-basal body protein n=1 Tax=Caulobacter radicis TaxID=2172650 RepID=A0A2T9JGQ3_9CAUL|nr:flagellar hook-basal body complex protein [Caulobacter radicis]PVM82855.1 flagellar hook-basal body protein [Caulobacter radicis]
MNGAFYIAATGLRAQQGALDVTANNIANLNTSGFKRASVRFSEMVASGQATVESVQPSGVASSGAERVFTQGDLRETGGSMDLAIRGDGFIELMAPSGRSVLWRGGALKVGEDGFLSAANGMSLRGMIAVPTGAQDLLISADGRVSAIFDDQTRNEIGRIDLTMVRDSAALSAIGEGLYELTDGARATTLAAGEDGAGLLVQGSVEASNVQISDEMVTLLLTQRAYAANAQVVQAGDQLMAIANGLKR